MPIELLDTESAGDEPEPGQTAYEAIAEVVADADEITIVALLGAIQSRAPWERVPPNLRRLLVALEGELFAEDGAD